MHSSDSVPPPLTSTMSASNGSGTSSGSSSILRSNLHPFPSLWQLKSFGFNSSVDAIEIDTDSFDIDGSATFASGKNKKVVKKKLAKQDFDVFYDQKKGGLYFNENGSDKGFGDGGIVAILKGAPDLNSDNLEFI